MRVAFLFLSLSLFLSFVGVFFVLVLVLPFFYVFLSLFFVAPVLVLVLLARSFLALHVHWQRICRLFLSDREVWRRLQSGVVSERGGEVLFFR